MRTTGQMIATHPARSGEPGNLVACIEACFDCEQACTSCADACLHEEKVTDLRHCIRTNLDCADVCAALGRALSRASRPDATLMRSLLQACIDACKACGEECRRHASIHEHCEHCADACTACDRACRTMLRADAIGV